MAGTRTLAQLRTEVRQRADIEGDPHIADSEVDRAVNQSCTALHALLVDMDETYFLSEMTLNTSAGDPTIKVSVDATNAPTYFYKLLHVEALISGWTRSLERWTFERRTLYKNSSNWGVTQYPVSYRLSRQSGGDVILVFAPVPDGVYPVTVDYVRSFATLTNDSDLFDGADGWDEWVVLDAAIKLLTKEESRIVDLTRERAEVMTRIAAQMRTPDLDHPTHVRDVDAGPWGGGAGPWGNL